MFIVIEGQDATGKDTQARLLAEYLRAQGKNVLTYSESGNGSTDEFVQAIAKANLNKDFDVDIRTHALLYLVNRYEQWRKIAEPALKKGDVVIVTRNWLSTLIYMGYVGGMSKNTIIRLHKLIMPEKYFNPDKMVVFTISVETHAKRLGTQGRTGEIWKSKGESFQQKLNSAYLKVIKEYNLPTLSAEGAIEEVQSELRKLFEL
ncbi:dTMP kinase [Candidatus Saccharibacteria bacterium]|nr:dTMP kinase [Candidatus Saccharibacteria bacterium]